MTTYIIRRLLLVPVLLFGVTVMIFGMLQFLDPDERVSLYIRGDPKSDAQVNAFIKRYCLDCPIHIQYRNWLLGTIDSVSGEREGGILYGNFGWSKTGSQPVADLIARRFPNTLDLTLWAIGPVILVGIWLGTAAAESSEDDKDRVLIKADGTSTYFLADIAYHEDKFQRGFQQAIDIWEQIIVGVLVANPPWPGPGYGARSDVRWPHKRSDKYIEYPIYLAYTAAVLEQAGFGVSFLDAVMDELSIEAFARQVADRKPSLILLETSTPSIAFDLQTAAAVKDASPGTFVALLGSHVTYFDRQTVASNPAVGAVVRGEFEQVAANLALALQAGGDLSGVLGLTYRDGGEARANPPQPLFEPLDDMPFPARHKNALQQREVRSTLHGLGENTHWI